MPSWQARLSTFLIRLTIKRRLAAAKDVAGIRAVLNRGGMYKVPTGIRITPASETPSPANGSNPADPPPN